MLILMYLRTFYLSQTALGKDECKFGCLSSYFQHYLELLDPSGGSNQGNNNCRVENSILIESPYPISQPIFNFSEHCLSKYEIIIVFLRRLRYFS